MIQSLSDKAISEHLSPVLPRKLPCPEVNFKNRKTTKYENSNLSEQIFFT